MVFKFTVKKALEGARLTELMTPHGKVEGPFFQFVATQGVIRGAVLTEDLEKMGVQITLANTYHLHLRPGEQVVAEAGGLHGLMQWDKPVTTDSGGYQVFSLGQHVRLDADGVTFRSPRDGKQHRLTPESTMQIQAALGADIVMPLDVCTPFRATELQVAAAVSQTTAWAKRCGVEHERLGESRGQALYGIVQGGVYPALRQRSAAELSEIGFFGYSIGGELRDLKEKRLAEVVAATTRYLPTDKPRYLMGYGRPEDIVEAVRAGVDQFDCVLPMRNGRHGQVFTDLNQEELAALLRDPEQPVDPKKLYTSVPIRNAAYAQDWSVLATDHPVLTKPYTKGYVHHLMKAELAAAQRIAVLQNIWFYAQFMRAIRDIIAST